MSDDAPSDAPAPHAIDWPRALVLAPHLERLRWAVAPLEACACAPDQREVWEHVHPPLTRLGWPRAATLQGLELAVTLLFELDRLLRIELAGPLDALALAALGATDDNSDDLGHHRWLDGHTRLAVDALDGVLSLEPDEVP
jgi:hypothetical protein